MIKMVTEAQHICDICQNTPAFTHRGCHECGKLFCYDCSKLHSIEYKSGVYSSGSRDGHYCLECNAKLIEKPTPLFTAYRNIKFMRAEYEAFDKEFDVRRKAAEKSIEMLLLI